MSVTRVGSAHKRGDAMVAVPSIRSDVAPGTTYYIRPGWVGDVNGWPVLAACDVATGRTIAERDDDDLTALVREMREAHPHLILTENAHTGALRSVPADGRL